MNNLLTLTLSGSVLALLLLSLRYFILRKMPSTVYYYAWLLVLLRFALPLPGLIPVTGETNTPDFSVYSETSARDHSEQEPGYLSDSSPGGLPAVSYEPQLPVQSAKTSESQAVAPAQRAVHSINWRSPTLWLSVWALGAVLSFGLTVLAYLNFTLRLRHKLHRPDGLPRELYASIPGRKPALFCTDAIRTPLMFGLCSPKIVLPEQEYDEELLFNILRHELMHFRRFDTLYKWIAVAILSAHWFNPLSWFIRKELNRACELSCDEMLLRSMDRQARQNYGETLLSMAASASMPAGVVATTFATEKRNLKERLEQIMEFKQNKRKMIASLLAFVLLASCAVFAGPVSSAETAAGGPVTEVTVSTVDELLNAIAP